MKIAASLTSYCMTAVLGTTLLLSGCASEGDSRTAEGAKTGAAVGAGVGLLLGILSGDSRVAVAGAAIGAGVGAGQGAYEGWRQDQDDIRTREITQAIRESAAKDNAAGDAEARAREELTRFLGVWQLEGWVESEDGRLDVSAQVNGNVEMSYFVELAYIDLQVAGLTERVWGTTMLGYEPDTGYSMITRLNALSEPIRVENGRFSQSSRTFSFEGDDYQVMVTFQTPDRFQIETIVQGRTVETYRLTRT